MTAFIVNTSPSSLLEMMVIAAVGGALVFFGLVIEKFSEWLDEHFLGEYQPHKKLESIGWRILMLGIAVEIGVAVWSANDEWQTRQMALNNDLHKQPVFAISGHIMFLLQPRDKVSDFDNTNLLSSDDPPSFFRIKSPKEGNAGKVSITFGKGVEMANSAGNKDVFIDSDNVTESVSTYGGDKLLRYDVYFGESQETFYGSNLTPEELDVVNIMVPERGEIVSGTAEINIDHDLIKRVFQIPKQTTFGNSVTAVESNGAFFPLNWSSKVRGGLKQSEEIAKIKSDMQARFDSRGAELESNANSGKMQRIISDEQRYIFTNLLKTYPRTPIKVFVNSNDVEAVAYADKIRGLLDFAGYNDNTNGAIKNASVLLMGTNRVPWQPVSNSLAFVFYPETKKYGLIIPISFPFNKIEPVISSGLTNDPAYYAAGCLQCVMWAFSGIGLSGVTVTDDTTLRAGEAAIIVPSKPH